MTAWGVAALGAGGLALVVGTVARGLGARGALTDEERRGAARLAKGLYALGGLLLVGGLVFLGLAGPAR